ncbi:MAG TPA: hypothetical protein VF021_07395 [Longimicrobiales bacterium]
MITIALTADQAGVIREILSGYHNTLLLELSKADSRDFRDMLRGREAVVADVLAQLAPVASVTG